MSEQQKPLEDDEEEIVEEFDDDENGQDQSSTEASQTTTGTETKTPESSEGQETQEGQEGQEGKAEEKPQPKKFRRPLNPTTLEALFFASGRPLSITRIAVEFGWEPKEVRQMTRDLAKTLKKIKAELQLLEVQRDRWILHLPLSSYPPEFSIIIDNLLLDYPKKNIHDDNTRKVLTHVAFYQPVSKAKLWKMISQDNPKDTETWLTIQKLEEILSILIQEGFVRLSGSPLQYKTTRAFADEFGFDSVRMKLKQQLVRRVDKKGKKKK